MVFFGYFREMHYLCSDQKVIDNSKKTFMNRKTMMMVLAALSFMLTACGDKQAKQVLVAENKTETAVEEQTGVNLDDAKTAIEQYLGKLPI